MILAVLQRAISPGELRSDIDLEATIDLLYAPIYYRLQRGTGSLSDAYIDENLSSSHGRGFFSAKTRFKGWDHKSGEKRSGCPSDSLENSEAIIL